MLSLKMITKIYRKSASVGYHLKRVRKNYQTIIKEGSIVKALKNDFLFLLKHMGRILARAHVKRVLYVLDNFPKVSETFILNELIHLKKKGVAVKILALRNPHEEIINKNVYDFDLLMCTKYLSGNDLSHKLKRISDFTKYYKKIDIYHAHFAHRAALCAMEMHSLLKKPFTFTAHAYEIFRIPPYSRDRLKLLVKNANAVITPSEYNKRYIVNEVGFGEDKIRIIRATIDHKKFITRHSIRETNRIIAIGRLTEKKGFQYLIEAMKTVTEHFPHTFLDIVGSGEQKAALKSLSEKLGISDRVHFLGDRTNEECAALISESMVAVLPCVIAEDGDRDVCPLTLQEAMSMKVPVVSTFIASIPELVDNGRNGILVPEKNVSALAEAIVKLLKNPALRFQIGANGREKIEKEFNIATQIKLQLSIWSDIIAKDESI